MSIEVTTESRRLIDMVSARCGTETAYLRHQKNGERVDRACRAAHRATQERNRRRKAAETAARKRAVEALIGRHQREYRSLYLAELHQALTEAVAR